MDGVHVTVILKSPGYLKEKPSIGHPEVEWNKYKNKALLSKEDYGQFALDMSPFEITRYNPNDLNESSKVKEAIQELGFQISNSDEAIWNKYRRED